MEDNFVKITNAVYKLLDFFPEGDPLKNKTKEKALAILENLTLISDVGGWVSLKNYLSPDREKTIKQLLQDLEILENYLKIGKYQGWIDNINFLILIKEYNKIKEEISLKKGRIEQNLGIAGNIESPAEISYKKELSVASKKTENPEDYSERQNQPSPKALARQVKILQILSERERVQVSDLVKELLNVTKRTIRRDLDDLLKKGKIVRMGEFNQVFYQIVKSSSRTSVLS